MDDVRTWLERSRTLGFLGPGPVEEHVTHAEGFATVIGEAPGCLLDLGSGGGVPGLVLAAMWLETEILLLDSSERRTQFLAQATAELGWLGRVRVVRARAEMAGRDPALRGLFETVVSRSFGPPAVVAECAAPLLQVGGRCVVSEPPDVGERWPSAGVALIGMAVEGRQEVGGAGYAVLRQRAVCPKRYPRREGVPSKRPLW